MTSGDTLLSFSALAGEPPASNPATVDRRNNHWVLDFDAATDETIYFSGVVPQHYDGGGITVYLHYSMASATSGNVVLDVAIERIGDGQQDIDSDGFATAQSVTDAVPGTSGHRTIASVAFTDGAQMDSLAVGESFRISVMRDADNASDTAAGDLELSHIEIRET